MIRIILDFVFNVCAAGWWLGLYVMALMMHVAARREIEIGGGMSE